MHRRHEDFQSAGHCPHRHGESRCVRGRHLRLLLLWAVRVPVVWPKPEHILDICPSYNRRGSCGPGFRWACDPTTRGVSAGFAGRRVRGTRVQPCRWHSVDGVRRVQLGVEPLSTLVTLVTASGETQGSLQCDGQHTGPLSPDVAGRASIVLRPTQEALIR